MLREVLKSLGLADHPRILPEIPAHPDSSVVISDNPATGAPLAAVRLDSIETYERTIAQSREAFRVWRETPAPVRGQVVRAIGDEIRRLKQPLGTLVSLEVGKILQEGLGEIQEIVDIADFAVGLSRQLYGLTMPSERSSHRIQEQWHPLGLIGVVTAFNFPAAVWGWNAMLAAVCGDVTIWKPSLFAPLTAIACNAIAERVCEEMGHPNVFRLVIGTDDAVGERLVADKRIPLISATGSCRMGRRVGQVVAGRLGRALLELGGNNAVIVDKTADLQLAAGGIFFSAVGTAGQRCTTTRRLIVHESVADDLVGRLARAYASVKIGDPLAEGTLVGPLINHRSVEGFLRAVDLAKQQGGEIVCGGKRLTLPGMGPCFVEPTIIRAPRSGDRTNQLPIAGEETFAPILYVFTFRDFDEAIALHNGVDQGLSSAIFTENLRAAERFTGPSGSDCGLAYVNLATSGAEIGGAFGGEKDTGGGRESGSDSWKAYMRRQTCTINSGGNLQLAQGIQFG
jgi:aldehyde dehydrogenase (NAD+)